MSHFLFIVARAPGSGARVGLLPALLRRIRERGHLVTVYLLRAAVIRARAGEREGRQLGALAGVGVPVLADAHSLREHGVDALAVGIRPAPIGELLGLLIRADVRPVWR